MSAFQFPEAPLTPEEKESIALAIRNATTTLRRKTLGWLQDNTFRPYSGPKELNTPKCIRDCSTAALGVLKHVVNVYHPHAPSIVVLEYWVLPEVQTICEWVRSLSRKMPEEDGIVFESVVAPEVVAAVEGELETVLKALRSQSPSGRHVPAMDMEAVDLVATQDRQQEKPGDPIFENPFADNDSRHSILEPYFGMMHEFRKLGEEYPSLSLLWKAASGKWLLWPPPRRVAGDIQGLPSSPGSDLHVERVAGDAANRLLGYSRDRIAAIRTWINPGRDRWLRTDDLTPWEFWLHAIREFWLNANEQVVGSGSDTSESERMAEEHGYLPTQSEAIGSRVWSLMVTEGRSLREVLDVHKLNNEISSYEDPAGWIQDGTITRAFPAFEHFCGVLASRQARRLTETRDVPMPVLDPVTCLRPQSGVPSIAPKIDYPRYMYHAVQDPRLVWNEAEEKAFGPEWSRTYIYQAYPKYKYHWNGTTVTVKNADEEAALDGG